MPYVPGDNWTICDISGKQILMSKSVKTWDGLRVDPAYWYPKHPQLMVRAVPDHMAVLDDRPRQTDVFIGPLYGYGSFCLVSPNGVFWTFYVADDGALIGVNTKWGSPVRYLYLGGYRLYVDDDGALHPELYSAPVSGVWRMASYNDVRYAVTVDTDLALLVTTSAWD